MSTTTRRVYHPTLNAWQDVPKASADEWKAAGWRLTKPDHISEDVEPAPLVENEPVVVTTTDASPEVRK